VDQFIQRFARDSGKHVEGITAEAMALLVRFHWPGNVRELENIVERAVALSVSQRIDVGDIYLDSGLTKSSAAPLAFPPDGMTLEQWEDEMIKEALRRADGNKSQAARLLGLSRNALRYRLSKIGLPDDE
jgi:DNA-binding NtrC family response regulator